MGLTIDLPSAGLLGISGAQAFEITANTTLGINKIYVCKQAADFTVTLPTTITADGGEILIKKVGAQTVTVAAALIPRQFLADTPSEPTPPCHAFTAARCLRQTW